MQFHLVGKNIEITDALKAFTKESDMYHAIDAVSAKLQTQLTKHKEKMNDH